MLDKTVDEVSQIAYTLQTHFLPSPNLARQTPLSVEKKLGENPKLLCLTKLNA